MCVLYTKVVVVVHQAMVCSCNLLIYANDQSESSSLHEPLVIVPPSQHHGPPSSTIVQWQLIKAFGCSVVGKALNFV